MNKQIEEMAVELWHNTTIREAEMCDDVAEYLYNADYRKASDVARKIFEELETVLYKITKPSIRADGILETKIMDGLHIRIEDYNAIRKKYESEGADDDTD